MQALPAALLAALVLTVWVLAVWVIGGASSAGWAEQADPAGPATRSTTDRTAGGATGRTTGADRDRRRSEVKEAHERALARAHDANAADRDARSHLATLEQQQAELQSELDAMSERDRNAADRVEVAHRHAREYVVEAYVGGGPPSMAATALDTRDANDLVWRNWMLRDHAGRAYEAISDLARERQRIGRSVDDLASRVDQNRSARQAAQNDLQRASAEAIRVEDDLAQAEQDRRELDDQPPQELFEVRGFRGAGDDGSPTPEESGNARGPAWASLRNCESSGNYNIVDGSGTYRGAYQFDLQTWRGVGGHGDPIDNTTAEQDLRAQILYDQRGSQPWPICGRFLRPPQTTTTGPGESSSTTSTEATATTGGTEPG